MPTGNQVPNKLRLQRMPVRVVMRLSNKYSVAMGKRANHGAPGCGGSVTKKHARIVLANLHPHRRFFHNGG